MNSRLILASTSAYRRLLLQRLTDSFECVSPNVDERELAEGICNPNRVARILAHAKAADVAKRFPESIVIGSDQVVSFEDEILGKPMTIENAIRQILRLSGKPHRLISAVCIIGPEGTVEFENEVLLKMREIDEQEAIRYIERDLPLDCAGSYKIEAAGIALFESINCSDFTAIVGLPLMQLSSELRRVGILIP
ncbi:MAG: septum formation protein Maf [Planctomyces sp.]|nr:septum formation protein Maf [Planctomyces sp.]